MNEQGQVWQLPAGPNCIARISWSEPPYREDIDLLLAHLDVLLKHNVFPTEAELQRQKGEPGTRRVRNFARNLRKCSCCKKEHETMG